MTLSAALLALGCRSPAPLREWTPEDHTQPQREEADLDGQQASEPTVETKGDATARAAQALWNVSCSTCHGRDGRGGGSARPAGAQMPDLASSAWQDTRTDETIALTIRDGRGMMPAFGSQMHAEAIDVLVAHVRTLRESSE